MNNGNGDCESWYDVVLYQNYSKLDIICPGSQTWDAETQRCEAPPLQCASGDKNCKDAGIADCKQLAGNPLNAATGNKFQRELDLRLTDIGDGIQFVRYYNSHLTDGPSWLGSRWRHEYARSLIVFLEPRGDGTYTYRAIISRPDGKAFHFLEDCSFCNTWGADANIMGRFLRTTSGFQYSDKGTTEEYDQSGRLVSITDEHGNSLTIDYDVSSRISRVDSETGAHITFGYDTADRISTMTDHIGRVLIYQYDANDNLEFVLYPDATPTDDTDNPRRQYHYNESALIEEGTDLPHALTGITDENGNRYATYEYYADGRAKASYHAGDAQKVTISYDDTTGERTVTNSLNQPSTYSTTVQLGVALVTDISGPGCSTCGTADSSYDYDPANNNLLSRTEAGITIRYGNYDTKGQYGCKVEGITDTATGVCAFDPIASPDARRVDYQYDARFYNKITKILAPSVIMAPTKAQCTEGVDCRVTTYTYDAWGNRLTETVSGFDPTGTPVTRTTTRQFNGPLHQLSLIDGPRPDAEVLDYTHYRYYPNDAAVPIGTRGRLKEIEDATGVLTRSNIQYTATGKVVSETRPNGLTLAYTYYAGNDRLETLTETDTTTATSRTTKWTYLASGEVQSITQAFGTVDATTLTFGYDAARRLTRLTDGLGHYIAYTLDTEGNRTFEKTYDNTGALTRQLNQTFDLYNRLDGTTQGDPVSPLETVTQAFAPDGTLDKSTDGKGRGHRLHL